MIRSPVGVALVVLCLVGCGGEAPVDPPGDSGTLLSDGGVPPSDGGLTDGGAPGDGGTAPDGGGQDAGGADGGWGVDGGLGVDGGVDLDGGSISDGGVDADGGVATCVDPDGDGYGEGCALGADCREGDSSAYQFLDGYYDEDGDGYTVQVPGSPASICSGATLPADFRADSLGLDCNDRDLAVNTACAAFPLGDIATPRLAATLGAGSAPVLLGVSTFSGGKSALFFAATDAVNGTELWRTDGTAAGTVMVKDSIAGSGGLTVSEGVGLQGKTLFPADDGVHGQELWTTDGTVDGTHLVKDLSDGGDSTPISRLIAADSRAFFLGPPVSTNGSYRKMAASDGTSTGTMLIDRWEYDPAYEMAGLKGKLYTLRVGLSVNDGRSHDSTVVFNALKSPINGEDLRLDWIVSAKGKLYLAAYDSSAHQSSLWVSDGTQAGTKRVLGDTHNDPLFNMSDFFAYDGANVYVRGENPPFKGIWWSNGQPGGGRYLMLALSDQAEVGETVGLGNKLVAVVNKTHTDSDPGRWQLLFGGGGLGMTTLGDFGAAGTAGNPATQLTAMGGKVYFVVDDGTHGAELWRTDGTVAGTQLVKDIYTGATGSGITGLRALGNKLVFAANDGISGPQPWASDGTADGTQPLRKINNPTDDSLPESFLDFGGQVLFVATKTGIRGALGRELWKTDGTAAGTANFADLYPGTTGSSPENLTPIDGTLYFSAAGPSAGHELWVSDGTPAGTVQVADLYPGTTSSDPHGFIQIGSNVVFVADTVDGLELWRTQGTAATTAEIEDINPGAADSDPRELTPFSGGALFIASSPQGGRELWWTDGATAAGTSLVKDIRPGSTGSYPSQLTPFKGEVWFAAHDGTHGNELWKTDGTEAGTVQVADLLSGSGSSSPQQLFVWNDALYFTASGAHGRELWKTTGGAPVELKDIYGGATGSNPRLFTPSGGYLYFVATDPDAGEELWRTDGTSGGTVRVRDICPEGAGSGITEMMDDDGVLLFFANDGVNGQELWRSDGTAAGTVLVRDVFPGTGGSAPHQLFRAREDGVFLFLASDGLFGMELWRTDGTSTGTRLVQDITPGAEGSRWTTGFSLINGRIYFGVGDGTHGVEPWVIDAADL